MIALPIDDVLSSIVERLREKSCVVVEAPPGAGKTTRVPSALAAADFVKGQVWVLEPRRIAARLASRFVAAELGEKIGGRVGYRVRFEDHASAATQILFVTEGVFLRRIAGDPTLEGIGAVVLDEFHERHLQTDAALALAWNLVRTRRPDLKLVVMSATLDAQPIATYLSDCPVVTSRGRRFDVALEYDDEAAGRPLEISVRAAVRKIVGASTEGHTLVFLPGAAEIRRVATALAEVSGALGIDVVPLHGDLSPDEQDRAVAPSLRRKVILSTNIAESSVTIDGVNAVVDSGFHRVPVHSPWSGLPSLRIEKISRASATQRAGRAGRTCPGRAVRLYSKHDHDGRPALDRPEIERLDASELVMLVAGLGLDAATLAWLAPPPKDALDGARALLCRLDALDADGRITATGKRMLEFPAAPRLQRILVEGERRGVLKEAARAVALLSERGAPSGVVDLVHAVEVAARDRGPQAATMARAADQLARIGRNAARTGKPDDALALAILTGYPDRVAKRRGPNSDELVLSSGSAVKLPDRAALAGHEWMCAVDVEERGGARGTRSVDSVRVRLACPIEPEWLLELSGEALREEIALELEGANGRVIEVKRLLYEQLTVEERRAPLMLPTPASAAFLFERVRRKLQSASGEERERADRLVARLAFLRRAMPELALESFADEGAGMLDRALAQAAENVLSLEELSSQPLSQLVLATLPSELRQQLDELAPERLRLGSRETRVEYPPDAAPFIASRLQDFFGLSSGPSIAKGRIRLVLHLLAPNQRAVQVTDDLAGFWSRTYPEVRTQLMRRYPRHAWPDDPRVRPPPKPAKPR